MMDPQTLHSEALSTGPSPRKRSRPWLVLLVLPGLLGLTLTERTKHGQEPVAVARNNGIVMAIATAEPMLIEAPVSPQTEASSPAKDTILTAEPQLLSLPEAAAQPSAFDLLQPGLVEHHEVRCPPTPMTKKALALALGEGHALYFGSAPNADRWACAWAQCAFEQAQGRAVHGNNVGHVTSPTGAGNVCKRRLPERVAKNPDQWKRMDVWFHVYDSPVEGAAAYWRLLATRYHSVIDRCDEAKPKEAAMRLANNGYFTGPDDPYVEGMTRLFVHARGSLIPRLQAEIASEIVDQPSRVDAQVLEIR